MDDITFPDELVAAQRAVHRAEQAVEDYRKTVDADRRQAAQPGPERHSQPVLRPWTDKENTRYAELHAAVVVAAGRRRELLMVFDGGGTRTPGEYEIVQQLHKAARAGVEA